MIVVGATAMSSWSWCAARRAPPEGVAATATAGAPRTSWSTNFITQENPLFANEPKKATEPPPAPGTETADPDKPKARPVAAAPRPRTADGREPQVRLDPVTKSPTPAVVSREKVDSFGDVVAASGPLTPDDVRNTYAANEVGLKRCYERSLENETTAVTKMV